MPAITTLALLTIVAAGFALLAAGLWSTRQPQAPRSVIRPITPPPPPSAPRLTFAARFRRTLSHHPDPLVAIFKTVFWLAMGVVLIDHLRNVQHGTVAYFVWLLTIGPHEIGHYLCWPFGWVLNIAGGSIWQVLLYVLLAAYTFAFRRRVGLSLIFWMITGHSLINLSVYIADAAERDLPLIFGMGKSHHDWWNLLSHYDTLRYDNLIAAVVRATGAGIVIAVIITGVLTTWWMPRRWLDISDDLLLRQERIKGDQSDA